MLLPTSYVENTGCVAGVARLASLLIALALGLSACADQTEPTVGRVHAALTYDGGTDGSGGTGVCSETGTLYYCYGSCVVNGDPVGAISGESCSATEPDHGSILLAHSSEVALCQSAGGTIDGPYCQAQGTCELATSCTNDPCGDADCNGYDDCSGQPSGCIQNSGDGGTGSGGTCGDTDCDGYDDCSGQPSGCVSTCGDADCDGYDDCNGQPSACIGCGDSDCNGHDDCSGQPSGCTQNCGDTDCDGYDDCSGQPSGCTYDPPCGDADCDGYDDCNGEPSACIGCGDADCDGHDDCSGQPSGYTESCGPPMSLCELAHRKLFYCLASSGASAPIDDTFASSYISHLLGPGIAPDIQMRGQPVVVWLPQEATEKTNAFVNDFITLHAQYPSSPFPSTQNWQLPRDPTDPLFQRIASECASLAQIGRWPTLQDWPNMVADITSPPTCSLFAEQFGDGFFKNAQRVEPMAQEVPDPEGPLAPPEPFPAPRHAGP